LIAINRFIFFAYERVRISYLFLFVNAPASPRAHWDLQDNLQRFPKMQYCVWIFPVFINTSPSGLGIRDFVAAFAAPFA